MFFVDFDLMEIVDENISDNIRVKVEKIEVISDEACSGCSYDWDICASGYWNELTQKASLGLGKIPMPPSGQF